MGYFELCCTQLPNIIPSLPIVLVHTGVRRVFHVQLFCIMWYPCLSDDTQLALPFTGPSALSFLQLVNAIYNLIYKHGTSQVCHFITIQTYLYFSLFSLFLGVTAFPFTQKSHFSHRNPPDSKHPSLT
jgi:hypothetical protein